MESLAQWFVNTLKDYGKIELNVKENFDVRDNIPSYMIDCNGDEELEEFLDNEFDGEVPMEFEFNGIKYELELDREF